MPESDLSISPALANLLNTYEAFLVADGETRDRLISDSDRHTLRALVEAAESVFDEIYSVLDRFDVANHPLPADLEKRESDLHLLLEATIDADMKLKGVPRDKGERRAPEELPCSRCGGPQSYNDRHDAYFCPRDDVWLEGRCWDPRCQYCRSRPGRPSEALPD